MLRALAEHRNFGTTLDAMVRAGMAEPIRQKAVPLLLRAVRVAFESDRHNYHDVEAPNEAIDATDCISTIFREHRD